MRSCIFVIMGFLRHTLPSIMAKTSQTGIGDSFLGILGAQKLGKASFSSLVTRCATMGQKSAAIDRRHEVMLY